MRAERTDGGAIGRAPSAPTVARPLTIGRDQLFKAQTFTVAAIESGVVALAKARDILADLQAILAARRSPSLTFGWIAPLA